MKEVHKYALLIYFFLVFSCRNKLDFNPSELESHIQKVIASNNVVFLTPPNNRQVSVFGRGGLGMPIGNGRMGGLIYANYDSLGIQLNHTDFWRYNAATTRWDKLTL